MSFVPVLDNETDVEIAVAGSDVAVATGPYV